MPPKDKAGAPYCSPGVVRYDEAAGGSKPLKKNKMKDERKGSVVWNVDSSEQLQLKQLNFREKFSFLFPLTPALGRQKSTCKFLAGSCSLSLEILRRPAGSLGEQ